MKRSCKKVDITDMAFLQKAMSNCLKSKRNQPGLVTYFANELSVPKNYVRSLIQKNDKQEIAKFVEPVLQRISDAIRTRTIELKPINRKTVVDRMSGKERNVGIQSIESCLYDHIAVLGLQDAFKMIGQFQAASIPDRGQLWGALHIADWLRDKRQRYYIKMDVRKCYESIPIQKLLELYRNKVANEPLLYLVEKLLEKHEHGLSIGSYLSQWSCNFYMAHAYHYIEESLCHIRRSRRKCMNIRQKLADHVIIYMDDILLLGRKKRYVVKAAEQLQAYIRDELGLFTKPWEVWDINEVRGGKPGFIDMMGFRCHRGYLTIRRKIWKKTRRTIMRATQQYAKLNKVCISTAKSLNSYYGYVKGSESSGLRSEYGVDTIMEHSSYTISIHAKQRNKRLCLNKLNSLRSNRPVLSSAKSARCNTAQSTPMK